MSTQQYFANVGGVFVLISFVRYGTAIIIGKAQPTIASWAIWGGLNTLVLIGMLSDGVANPQSVLVAIGSLIIFVLALRFGKPGWSIVDKVSLAGGVIAIGLWLVSGTPTLAIVMSLTAIAIGNIPTYASVMEDSSREDWYAWMIAAVASALTLISVENWSVSSLAQPVVFLATQLLMLYLIFMPRKRPYA